MKELERLQVSLKSFHVTWASYVHNYLPDPDRSHQDEAPTQVNISNEFET